MPRRYSRTPTASNRGSVTRPDRVQEEPLGVDAASEYFFAYGMLRRGEIAYPRIEGFVAEVLPGTVPGRLEMRDGVTLLVLTGDRGVVTGDVIRFRADAADAALAAINKLEPERTYRWSGCQVDTERGFVSARVLVARSPGRGSHPLGRDYRSRDDPLFIEAMDEVRVVSDSRSSSGSEVRDFFRSQMAYMLLWSAIERFCSLRYGFGLSPVERGHRLAREPAFASALRRVVDVESHRGIDARVYRADRPSAAAERLDPDDPVRSIDFYYQARSNIVHRGKSAYNERTLVELSLKELTAIFEAVLDETLGARTSPGI